MKGKTKPRSYNSESRRLRTSQLRSRILDAAREQFTAQGIDKVTIEALAAQAGVAGATVYALFRSKVGILEALVRASFFGPNYAAVAERLQHSTDPPELLRITAAISRVIFDTEKAEIGLIRGATAFAPELRRIEVELEQIRYDLQEPRARLLVRRYEKARTLGFAKVRDVMWMLTGRDLYRMFVLERGWSSEGYEQWLAATLIDLLTDPGERSP